MAEPPSMRLAQAILEENSHLVTFDVDPMDEHAAELLTKALESCGCIVQQDQFSTRLTIRCPDNRAG